MVTDNNGLTNGNYEQDQMSAWLCRASQTSARLWPRRGRGENQMVGPDDQMRMVISR